LRQSDDCCFALFSVGYEVLEADSGLVALEQVMKKKSDSADDDARNGCISKCADS